MITWWDAHFRKAKLTGITKESMCINDEIYVPNGLNVSVIMFLEEYSMSLWDYFNSWLDPEYNPITIMYM